MSPFGTVIDIAETCHSIGCQKTAGRPKPSACTRGDRMGKADRRPRIGHEADHRMRCENLCGNANRSHHAAKGLTSTLPR